MKLTPSNDPNLMTRPGCATCHGTLEPLAAWFSRVGEGDYRWLPASAVPTANPKCKVDAFGKPAAFCRDHYDPAFSTVDFGLLRGAYASREHAAVVRRSGQVLLRDRGSHNGVFLGEERLAPEHDVVWRAPAMVRLARSVLDALEGRTAAMMANHGTVTYGRDVAAAVEATELLEWAATVYFNASQIGTPRVLDEADRAAVVEAVIERGYGKR